jgi:hypothetical protein
MEDLIMSAVKNKQAILLCIELYNKCIAESLAENDCVVLEQVWQGTFAVTEGNHIAGEISKLRVASFFTLDNGVIVKQIDYCASVI